MDGPVNTGALPLLGTCLGLSRNSEEAAWLTTEAWLAWGRGGCILGWGGAAASGSWGRPLPSQGRGNVPSSSPRELPSHCGAAFSLPTHQQLLRLSLSPGSRWSFGSNFSISVSWMHPGVSRPHKWDLVFRGSQIPPPPKKMTTSHGAGRCGCWSCHHVPGTTCPWPQVILATG